MRVIRYAAKRLLAVPPLVLALVVVVFIIVHLLPGSPVGRIAGGLASPEIIRTIRSDLRLDEPLYKQVLGYLVDLTKGDWGTSLVTGNSVLADLADRVPATLELITVSLLGIVLIMVPLGILSALKPSGIPQKIVSWYGLLAGGIPEFWFGLILIYVFFVKLHIAAPPIGRLADGIQPPRRITGAYILDGLLRGDLVAVRSAISHIILPAATLILVFGGIVLKLTNATMREVLKSDHVYYATVCGLKQATIIKYALRSSLPSIITVLGVMYGYLLGGAVLVETIFTWSGIGQYSVQALLNGDYVALQGFAVVAGVFSIMVYLLVDIALFTADPRIDY